MRRERATTRVEAKREEEEDDADVDIIVEWCRCDVEWQKGRSTIASISLSNPILLLQLSRVTFTLSSTSSYHCFMVAHYRGVVMDSNVDRQELKDEEATKCE